MLADSEAEFEAMVTDYTQRKRLSCNPRDES